MFAGPCSSRSSPPLLRCARGLESTRHGHCASKGGAGDGGGVRFSISGDALNSFPPLVFAQPYALLPARHARDDDGDRYALDWRLGGREGRGGG